MRRQLTRIISILQHSYGFIQCAERQARLFFHFSEYKSGPVETLKIGGEYTNGVNIHCSIVNTVIYHPVFIFILITMIDIIFTFFL